MLGVKLQTRAILRVLGYIASRMSIAEAKMWVGVLPSSETVSPPSLNWPSIAVARILVGLLLLVLGRRLFWLFVGAVGFVAGIRFADRYLQGYPDQTIILFSVIAGLVCMALAVALRKVALGAAGFLAGGYLLMRFVEIQPIEPFSQQPLLAFIVGGVAGALLISTVFNLTLIVLSALGGAALICESLQMNPQLSMIVYSALAITGVIAQTGLLKKVREAP